MHWTRGTFVIDRRPSYRFQVAGNRYTPVADTNSEYYAPERRLSLVFLHGTNLFKECFEPIIELLFQKYPTIHSDSGENLILEEAWSIECPNHGESAILNAEDIRRESTGPWSFREYGDAAYTFWKARPGGHDLSRKKIVLVGYSDGGVIIPFLTHMEPKINIHSIILGDPIMGPRCPDLYMCRKIMSDICICRQDVWPSREHAKQYFSNHGVTKTWSPEAIDLFVRYALVDHPARSLPAPFTCRGVTLACSREHQSSIHISVAQDPDLYELMAAMYASKTPVHFLYVDRPDPPAAEPRIGLLPKTLSCKGFRPTTAHPVRGGHTFFQSEPEHSTELLVQALRHDGSSMTSNAVARL